jgi:hypothetical protein
LDSNQRPSGYEPDELPLLHPAPTLKYIPNFRASARKSICYKSPGRQKTTHCGTIKHSYENIGDSQMGKKETTDLKTFIENVNKKDKTNGKKVVFDFVKRKRK